MQARIGICSNFGLCSKADTREAIPSATAEFACPECGRPLTDRGGGASGGRGAGGGGGNRKAVLGILAGVILLLGGVFAFLVWPQPEDKTALNQEQQQQQDQPQPPPVDPQPAPVDPPIVPPGQESLPPQEGIVTPPTRGNNQQQQQQQQAPQRQQTTPPTRQQQQQSQQEEIVTPPHQQQSRPPARNQSQGARASLTPTTLQARLLSPISTKTSREGDQFTAKVEGGPYNGAILTGHVTKLEKKRKDSKIGFQFETITLNGTPVPIKADLKGVTNAEGAKGVDDENHVISANSKKKTFILGAVGGAVGGLLGKITGGNKGAVVGATAGAATGVVLGLTVVSQSKDIHFVPGSVMTLDVSEGRQ
jgi:hypothetical protein